MEPTTSQSHHVLRSVMLGLSFLAAVLSLGYRDYLQNSEHDRMVNRLVDELQKNKQGCASTSLQLLEQVDSLVLQLRSTMDERNELEGGLLAQQDIIDRMQRDVQSALGEVGTLQKLSVTDKELLTKYSRVYFLNENYTPRSLIAIPAPYIFEPEKVKRVIPEVLPFLQILLDDAIAEGIDIQVLSSYRSFYEQSVLKSAYTMLYGGNTANKFSADQGYSEHQLGSTVDFTTAELGMKNATFAQTSAYQWLLYNAYHYGFILSYPKGNAYYVFEPWHWRFVGKQLALFLRENSKNFYDLSQREIDSHRSSLFDE